MSFSVSSGDTTQRMRSAQYPTPAELDAYAKKVANTPLTIKIFPNSVKVPQRNHVRRTVNGLDAGGARYSPYPPSQSAAKAGLLAIVKAPTTKGIIKDFTGTRVTMNAPGSGYGPAPSTLTLQHAPQPLQRPPQHQQGLPQHSQSLQPLQQQQQHQGIGHHAPSAMPQHPQGMGRTQPLSHPPPLGHPGPQPPPALLLQQQQQHLQQPPPGLQGGTRKLTDADAPPNVTVSTSTIPLSMAGNLHQGRQADLSTIVHQINQFCQARAQGAGATSMCEGQIANPSPISRNLLINASSRVAMHSGHSSAVPPGLGHSSCTIGAPEKSVGSGVPLHNMGAINRMAVYHNDLKQQQQQHLQHQQNPQQHTICHQQHQQMMSWNQHQLAHLQHVSDGAGHPCKAASRDPGFPCKGMNYPPELCVGQPYTLKPPMDKPTPSPPVVNNNTMPPGTVAHYTNGQYYHQVPVWGNILPTPNSDSSGSQELPAPFHGPTGNGTGGTNPTQGVDCAPTGGTAHYRPAGVAGGAAVGQTNLMQTADYMGGDFQTPCFRDQNLGLMGKMSRPPPMAHGQHPGYR